jgi:lipoteichoic acid synthase
VALRVKKSFFEGLLTKRIHFVLLLTIIFWLKSLVAYFFAFNLGIESTFQYFILILNPIAAALLFISAGLYIKNVKASYTVIMLAYIVTTILLFSNIVYYREFTDFLTVNTILGAGKVASGLGESALKLFRPLDILYVVDLAIFPILLVKLRGKLQTKPVKKRLGLAFSTLAVMLFSGNLFLAEADRPELLSRTFSRDYLVKYLGINVFTVYDGWQTFQTQKVRADASENDLEDVLTYVDSQYAAPNAELFGIAEGKNVIYLHLESIQQFVINYQLVDEAGTAHEVMPFVNSLYNGQETFSFNNFFHQVKAGKTADSETLIDNSLFGLSQGALFTQLGGKNTFEAAPNILKQTSNYTSAVFHGNNGNFWNRNETYKRFGYDYFFDSSYYEVNDDNSFQYGLHDKPLFEQSIQYLEHLQQPFYTKFLAVTNHYPYSELTGAEAGFPLATTSDATINGYFATANYLDRAVEEFFNYLKASGLYENSVIILYGDHYGISNARNKTLVPLLDTESDTFSNFDNAALQRVPYMIHIPGQTNGGVNETYGGQIDALPTLLHLLGIETNDFLFLGQDLFSAEANEVVAFRDGDFVTPDYTYYASKLYDTRTGALLTAPSAQLSEQIDTLQAQVNHQLAISDQINNGDLLRFETGSPLQELDSTTFDYKNALEKMQALEAQLGRHSTSLYSQRNQQTSQELFQTKTYQDYLTD